MMTFLATYEIGKDKSQITDEDIMVKVKERCETTNRDYLANPTALFTQNLKMGLMVKDVPDRVAKYFRQFEKIIADNGFHEHLGRGSPSDDDYVARMKQRTKILVDNLSPPMLRDEIKGMLELVKFRHIRTNDQALYKLILERAELQQLFYNRFRQADSAKAAPRTSNRKGGKVPSTQENTRSDSGQRSSNEGGKAATGPGNSGQGQNQPRKWGSGRTPPRTGCLHCKQDHWLRDCPVATPEEKEAARATQQSKSWKVKRAAIGKHDDIGEFADKGAIPTKGADDEEYSVVINGAVEISMCPDTGADKCILPATAVNQVRAAGGTLKTTRLIQPTPVEGVGGKITLCHEAAQIDVQIRTSAGPVNLYKLDCLVVEGETQFLLSKKVMKRLGIDVKRAFEQLANTSIELNHDDFPDEPEVGEVVDADIERELDRMCKEVNEVLSD
ncbi:hypothetical protein PF008_g31263, partial [Phytophthora fragariae]